jgi:hypothetical protein
MTSYKRFTAGRVINVLSAICWIIGSILGIVTASISTTQSAQDFAVYGDARTYIYVASFALFVIGSTLQVLKDIVTLQVLRSRCCSCLSLIPSFVVLVSSCMWFTGSLLFNIGKMHHYHHHHYYPIDSVGKKEYSGFILWSVGAGLLWIGSVMHLIKSYAKATRSTKETSELWAQVISEVIHLHGTIVLFLGSIAYIVFTFEDKAITAGNIMWIVGFSCIGVGRVVQFIHIPQSHEQVPAIIQHVPQDASQEPANYHVIPYSEVYSANQPINYDPSMFYQSNVYPSTASSNQYMTDDERQPLFHRQ